MNLGQGYPSTTLFKCFETSEHEMAIKQERRREGKQRKNRQKMSLGHAFIASR